MQFNRLRHALWMLPAWPMQMLNWLLARKETGWFDRLAPFLPAVALLVYLVGFCIVTFVPLHTGLPLLFLLAIFYTLLTAIAGVGFLRFRLRSLSAPTFVWRLFSWPLVTFCENLAARSASGRSLAEMIVSVIGFSIETLIVITILREAWVVTALFTICYIIWSVFVYMTLTDNTT